MSAGPVNGLGAEGSYGLRELGKTLGELEAGRVVTGGIPDHARPILLLLVGDPGLERERNGTDPNRCEQKREGQQSRDSPVHVYLLRGRSIGYSGEGKARATGPTELNAGNRVGVSGQEPWRR